jgi:hypothetical protein
MQMLDTMRKPLFLIALIAILLAVLVELGSMSLVSQKIDPQAAALDISAAGKAVPSMAFLDGLLLFATTIIGIALLIPERLQSKVQGIVTLIFAIVLLVSCIMALFKYLTQLILMVSLLMAPIFGTIAYFAIWAHFDTGSVRIALSLIMLLKIIFALCLVLSQQRFLQNKGLVLIIATSFLATLLITFVYGLVPGFLVSIADVIASLVICVLAIIWGCIYMVGGVISVVKVIV